LGSSSVEIVPHFYCSIPHVQGLLVKKGWYLFFNTFPNLRMLTQRNFQDMPDGASFELLFRWGECWQDIHVYPVNNGVSSTHYIVQVSKNLQVIIRFNEYGEWEEMQDGVTELARHLGKAIATYCFIHPRS
jgi:hypothetical protein